MACGRLADLMPRTLQLLDDNSIEAYGWERHTVKIVTVFQSKMNNWNQWPNISDCETWHIGSRTCWNKTKDLMYQSSKFWESL